jgi:riboflavin transporter FmnP
MNSWAGSTKPHEKNFLVTVDFMEVKINREIRDYTESMFFGLSLRQFLFSLLAVAVAVSIYFGLRDFLGTDTVSWMCILGAFPFAALGFIKYHGMTAEQFIFAYIKSEFLMPRQLSFHSTNIYYEAMKPYIAEKEKEEYKRHD